MEPKVGQHPFSIYFLFCHQNCSSSPFCLALLWRLEQAPPLQQQAYMACLSCSSQRRWRSLLLLLLLLLLDRHELQYSYLGYELRDCLEKRKKRKRGGVYYPPMSSFLRFKGHFRWEDRIAGYIQACAAIQLPAEGGGGGGLVSLANESFSFSRSTWRPRKPEN